jgi:hypothetical protein
LEKLTSWRIFPKTPHQVPWRLVIIMTTENQVVQQDEGEKDVSTDGNPNGYFSLAVGTQ